jgi:hypothetical protein
MRLTPWPVAVRVAILVEVCKASATKLSAVKSANLTGRYFLSAIKPPVLSFGADSEHGLPGPVNPRWRNCLEVGLAESPGDLKMRIGLREGQRTLVVITRYLDDASFPTPLMVKSSLHPLPES